VSTRTARRLHQVEPGQAVLITGTSSGIGEATAKLLVGLGYTVLGTVRHDDDGNRLRGEVADPDRFVPVRCDVAEAETVAAARGRVLALLDDEGLRLAGVFSNAGIAMMRGDLSAEGCPIETQERVMAVNHFGAVRVLQAFLPRLRADRGRVVVNSALMTHTVLPFNAGYAEAKLALEGFADSLRREVRPHGVRVTIIRAAAISSALEEKQDVDAIPADGPYPEQHAVMATFLGLQARRAGAASTSPDRFAEKVAFALQAPRPPTRMIVGGGARPIWLLGLLPDRAQDAVFATAVRLAGRRG